jgi:hypothetical protein
MKRNIIGLIVGLLISISGYSCSFDSRNYNNYQDSKKETRDVKQFNSIGLSVSGDLILVQGSPQKVVLEGSSEDLDKIETEVDGSSLEIKSKSHFSRIGRIKIYITVENIEALAVSGSGSIVAQGPVKTDHLNLAVSGSGKITLNDLKVNSINSAVSGSGAINLSGSNAKVNNHDIAISGSGNVFAENIETQVVKVGISGSGSCKVFATDKLEAGVSGSGDVYYKGGATVDAAVSGSGKVRSME